MDRRINNKRIFGLRPKTYLTVIIIIMSTFLLLSVLWTAQATFASSFDVGASTYKAPVVERGSQYQQIHSYIQEVFKDQSSNAFKVLACENRGLNPNAQGHNKDGSLDTGIFQINSFWANPAVLKDYKTNVNMAYQIYLRGGWNEWACESVWKALERNDTI